MREMKHSGIEWVGKIPAHWEITKLKTNFTYEKGKNAALYTKEYVGLHKGNYPVYSGQTENNGIMGTIDTFDYDLDECVFSTTVGAKVMTPMYLSGKFSLSQNCLIMKPIGTYLCKMLYYCLEPLFDCERELIPSYMQPSLRFSDLNKYCLPQPPISEQQAIADYLDGECARIDGIVEKQRQIIEKLKEYKKSVITEAVTRGLNPTAPMKDSGIEWIGKIPAHWEVCKIKNIICSGKDGIKIGPFGSALTGKTRDIGEYRVYSQANLVADNFDFAKNYIEKSDLDLFQNYIIKPEDILLSMMGTIGKCKIMPKNKPLGIMDSHLLKIRLSSKYIPKFFAYVYDKDSSNVVISQLLYYSKGSIMDGLNSSIVKNIQIPLVPLSEQQEIIDYLDGECARIDTIIEKRERMIELMTEYKKSLIYECVTGKKEIVDVVE